MKLSELLVRIGYYGIVLILLIDVIINKVNAFDILYCCFLTTLAVFSIVLHRNYNVMRYFYFIIVALLINHFYGKIIDKEDTIRWLIYISEIVICTFVLFLSLKSLNLRKDCMDKKGYNYIRLALIVSILMLLIQLLQIIYLYNFCHPIINIIILILAVLLILNVMSFIKPSWRNLFVISYCLYSVFSVRSIEIIYNYINLNTPYRQIYSHFYEFSQIGCNGYYIIDDMLTYEYPNIFLSVALIMLIIKKDTISNVNK